MESTLKALADLLLEAVPTILFFIVLAWYLKRVFFKPMAALLEERRKATEGVRALAQQASEAADQKQSEFERALQVARHQMWDEHEKLRRQWSDEQTQEIGAAREQVSKEIEAARAEIAAAANQAQSELQGNIDGLSESIVNSLLRRKAA